MQTTRATIDSGWRVRELIPGTFEPGKVDWLPAQVPGHIHLDLMRAGVIQDPIYRIAERSCAWVDEADWEYETTFDVDDPAPPHAYLRFNGLDTIAEIYLNGALLAETDNMFIEHECAVGTENGNRKTESRKRKPKTKNRLEESDPSDPTDRSDTPEPPTFRPGTNSLRIIFRSALRIGRERQQGWLESQLPNDPTTQRPLSPHWFVFGPRSFVRKAQYMFGWDWGPELVSCGIWKPVELIVVLVARLVGWSHHVTLEKGGAARVHIQADIQRSISADSAVQFKAIVAGRHYNYSGIERIRDIESVGEIPLGIDVRVVAILQISDPELWDPNVGGKDGPPVYTLWLRVEHDGEEVDKLSGEIGLRTVELNTDSQGSFQFRINGEDTFIKGANWIPAHSFPSRMEYEHSDFDFEIDHLILAAKSSGINMLRVWGGGIYESDYFYQLCDQHGILVWQDFGYGCAYYPDDGDWAEKAEVEARAAVKRLRNHPSLAVWCGNNECHQVWHDHWEGKENPAPRFLGEKLYHEILPRVVAEEDPGRPYWPGSPFGGENPNSEDEGDRHNWNVWHGAGDWIHYQEDRGRFISEFGFASSCGLNAWDKCLAESDKSPYSPAVRWHDKTRKGYEKYLELVKLHFPEPVTLEDLVYYTQLNQAEALKCGIEHWRRSKGRCWGTLFWQLNDCWPVQSWSIIDSELEPKAAYFAVKRAYAPVLLSLLLNGDSVEAHLTSDLREHIQGDVTIAVESFDGDLLMDEKFEAYVDANGTALIGALDVSAMSLHRRDVYVYARFEPYWDMGIPPVENFLLLAEPKDLRLPNPILTAEIAEDAESFCLTLTAQRFAPYVWWRFDGMRTPLTAERNFFHLRAAESKVLQFDVRSESVDELRARLRIRSL